jgi:CheY-like chemotaxis protein
MILAILIVGLLIILFNYLLDNSLILLPFNHNRIFFLAHYMQLNAKEKVRIIMNKILIIDRQRWIMDLVNRDLNRDGYIVSVAEDAEKIEKHFEKDNYDLLLLSYYLKYGHSSREVLKQTKTMRPNLPVIILAARDKNFDRSLLKSADGFVSNSYNMASELKQEINMIFHPNEAPRVYARGIFNREPLRNSYL